MEIQPLKVLFVGDEGPFARDVAAALGKTGGTIEISKFDTAFLAVKNNPFSAIIFEPQTANAAALFQITSLAVQTKLPVVVIGPSDESFELEAVSAGAQDFLPKDEFSGQKLERKIRTAMERHHERMSLIAEKENYYGIFDHLVEGIFRTTEDGHYLLCNIALAKIYGYDTPAELMARVTDIAQRLYVEPGRREEFIRMMREHDTIGGFESPIYRKDGSIIWISENCRAVRDDKGNLLYYEGTVVNITRRRQAEQALRNSESLYHSLVETMPQNVFRKDLQGRFTFANQQYCNHYNCKLEDILGKTDFDFFPKELAEQYTRDDQRVMQSAQTSEIVEEHHPIGQEKRITQVVKTPLYGADGKVVGIQGIFWDITEQKLAEERIRKTSAELARSREELQAKNAVMEESLLMAREVQLAMVVQQYPNFPSNASPEESALQFNHRYLPAETVSGDFFSISALSDSEVGVFICDVTGHGVRSSLVTAMMRALVEELKPIAHNPGQFMRKLNSDLCNILKNTGSPMLTTAFYLVVDSRTGIARFANAGHPKPLILRRSQDKIETLANASGHSQPALGLFDDPPYQTTEIKVAPGDLVLLFTDGLYEVQGPNEELYSQQRMILDMKNLIQKPSAQLFDELLEVVRNFSVSHEFEDDVCMVGIDFKKHLE